MRAFLPGTAIDQHFAQRKRFADMTKVVAAHPQLLGIGLDEKAALVVSGDRFEVIGEGRAAIYDNQKHGGSWWYWLKPGDKFDLRTRTVLR